MSQHHTSDIPFPIVGIGASAGGLKALETFLFALPKDFPFAVVFIQHLSPRHKSLLPDLLTGKRPDLDITEIKNDEPLLSGRIYICPPGSEVRIRECVFHVAPLPAGHTHYPIDEFFESLAEEAKDRATAVILSGAGTDGARGIQAVRNGGGCVFVQEPETAEFPGMPLAAIDTGEVDGVFDPAGIADEILKLQKTDEAAQSHDAPLTPEEFETFYRLIQERTGHRFVHYKKSVVSRRVRRRMYLAGVTSVKDYLDLVAGKDSEARALAYDLMIGVTSFFRDHTAWKALNQDVVRKLAMEETDVPLRVWTPACATGEEAYSIAITLLSELTRQGRRREVQVFATDVNDQALERAREGKYPASIAADLPQEHLQRYFKTSEDGQSIIAVKAVRERVIFAKQDLLTDPPFSRLDLIICRNLLIYLESDAQDKCLSLFHYALKPGGYLFLGNAESAGRNKELFKVLGHKKCRIYQKEEAKPTRLQAAVPFAVERAQQIIVKQAGLVEQQQPVIGLVQGALIDEYAPAAIAIDQNYDILYNTGPTNRYLRQPRGIPTKNLLELLPDALANRLRSALFRTAAESKPISIRASIPAEDEKKRQVTLRISKIGENLYLIVFRKRTEAKTEPETFLPESPQAIEETAVRQLESELATTRADLQTHIEQLKSMNEELQSSNEELQAANEELETSREELQSLNEELITVNAQLQEKIEEQEETNNDLNNFLSSANIPTVFLDREFKVRRFTPAMSKLIKLIPSDIGRPLIDMSQENLGPDLITDAKAVLETLTPVKKEFHLNGTWYVRSVLPYRTLGSRIEGVVITYNDVTDLKRAEAETLRLASFPRLNPNPIVEVDIAGNATFMNPAMEKILLNMGLAKEDATVFLPRDLPGLLREWDRKTEVTLNRDVEIKDRAFGETIHFSPKFGGARIYAFEITERKKAEEELKKSEERVRRKLDSILSPEGDIGDLDLSDIIDAGAVQALMDDFYKLARMPMSIVDLRGRMLVGVGWQKICMEFHRANPETCRNCIESDLQLSAGVPPGEFKLYKCKNNMWDVATPLIVGGKHMGNLFMGQFFFDGEPLEYESFRAQAGQYGFNEKEYIAALEAVPRLSRENLNISMAFFLKLADVLSKSSYGSLKLARALAERDALTDSLRAGEERLKRAQEIAHLGSWELDFVNNVLTWSDEVYRIFGLQPREFGATYEAFLEYVHPDDRAAVNEAYSGSIREGKDTYEIEHRVVRKSSGEIRFVHEKCQHFRDETGKIIRSVGMVHDVTDRKLAEEQVQRHVEELRAVNEELMRFNKAAVGRELRMIKLKKEVNDFLLRAGEPPRYRLDFEKEEPSS